MFGITKSNEKLFIKTKIMMNDVFYYIKLQVCANNGVVFISFLSSRIYKN